MRACVYVCLFWGKLSGGPGWLQTLRLAEAILELTLLPPLSMNWDHRCVSSRLASESPFGPLWISIEDCIHPCPWRMMWIVWGSPVAGILISEGSRPCLNSRMFFPGIKLTHTQHKPCGLWGPHRLRGGWLHYHSTATPTFGPCFVHLLPVAWFKMWHSS